MRVVGTEQEPVRADLVAQGRNVELFGGVEEWFDEIAAYLKENYTHSKWGC